MLRTPFYRDKDQHYEAAQPRKGVTAVESTQQAKLPTWKLIDLASREEFRFERISITEAKKRNREYEAIGSTLAWLPAPRPASSPEQQQELLASLLGTK